MNRKDRFWLVDWRWWFCAIVYIGIMVAMVYSFGWDDDWYRWILYLIAAAFTAAVHDAWVEHDRRAGR